MYQTETLATDQYPHGLLGLRIVHALLYYEGNDLFSDEYELVQELSCAHRNRVWYNMWDFLSNLPINQLEEGDIAP